MSLPKSLYDTYKELCKCSVVTGGSVTAESLAEFQTLVNKAQPTVDNVEGTHHRSLVKSMYLSNPVGFMQYVSTFKNRVCALVLWTESKRIVRFFNLQGKVHLSWDPVKQEYLAVEHVQQHGNDTRDLGDVGDVGDVNYRQDRQDRRSYTREDREDRQDRYVDKRRTDNTKSDKYPEKYFNKYNKRDQHHSKSTKCRRSSFIFILYCLRYTIY